MNTTLLSFGETLWDLLPGGPQLGGAPANFAYRAQELGSWAFLVTRLGQDDLGRKAMARLQQLGMDPSYIQWDASRPTGTVPVKVDAKGAPDFTILKDVAYDFIEATPDALELAGVANCICFGTLAQRSAGSRAALHKILEAGASAAKVLDVNLRRDCFTADSVRGSVERAHILKLNDQEVGALRDILGLGGGGLPEFFDELFSKTALTTAVVTLGEKGSFGGTSDGGRVYEPGYRVKTVDTCGSGDAFTAGFVHELLRGGTLQDCCRLGNILGAIVATQPGATTPIAPAEVQRFQEQPPERLAADELQGYQVGP